MERVAMDIMGPLPRSNKGNRFILVIGDYFTKWIEAVPMPNQVATTVAEALVTNFIARFGTPMEIHSDQGTNFESELLKEICTLLGVHKTRTTAFRPQSDGFIERFNRTLLQMVCLYTNPQQTNWDEAVPLAAAAYRATPQDTTGQSPNLLMFGREIMMPVDLLLGTPPGETPVTTTTYGTEVREKLETIFRLVRETSGKAMKRQKKLYDRNKVHTKFPAGTLVWLADSHRTKGKSPKLQRKWKGPLLVISRYSDVTYLLAENAVKTKVVHFDRLKPYHGEKSPKWVKTVLAKHRDAKPQYPLVRNEEVNPDSEYENVSDSESE
jgi:hypothetical protein